MGEENFVQFGTPLTPLDEDNIHVSKAPKLSEQIVTDKQGRRRFHGAFTGGFSAGYFNSVGSKEGFTPSNFVSSRLNRAEKAFKNVPTEFMDEEDLEHFGIASQRIHATSNYEDPQASTKRKRGLESFGPIPGQPVLEELLKPVNVTVGMQLLMKLGWRPGQGIGPRLSKREKRRAKKILGKRDSSSSSSDTESECKAPAADFAPDDVENIFFKQPKSDQFGIGYKPLERGNVLGGTFAPKYQPLTMLEKKKKVAFQGQAFGVGAFEEEDRDIYTKEDMSDYDFVLGPKEEKAPRRALKSRWDSQVSLMGEVLEGFRLSTEPLAKGDTVPLPALPPNYRPWHSSNRRRFDVKETDSKGERLSAEDRQKLLSNPPSVEIRSGVKKTEEPSASEEPAKAATSKFSNTFTEAEGPIGGPRDQGVTSDKPFATDPEKQKRYEVYLKTKGMDTKAACSSSLTEWERERERQEFVRMAFVRPSMPFNMASRFTSATLQDNDNELGEGLNDMTKNFRTSRSSKNHFEPELSEDKKAAKSKMFGPLTQTKDEWHPDRILCKRFNVPHPYPQSTRVGVASKTKDRSTIFDFLSPSPRNASSESASTSSFVKEEAPVPPLEEEEETYGLKVPVSNPPTLDLFKAIFQDSSDDSETEMKDDEPSTEGVTQNDSSLMDGATQNDSSSIQCGTANDSFSSRSIVRDNSEEHNKTGSRRDEDRNPSIKRTNERKGPELKETELKSKDKKENENVEGSNSWAGKAKGVFKGIDFTALNQYRRHEPPKPEEKDDRARSETPPPFTQSPKNRRSCRSSDKDSTQSPKGRRRSCRSSDKDSSDSSIDSSCEETDSYGPTPLQEVEDEDEEYGPAPPPHMLGARAPSNPPIQKFPFLPEATPAESVKEKEKKKKKLKKHKSKHKKKKTKKKDKRRR